MALLQESVICILAAVGLCTVVWLIAAVILDARRVDRTCARVWAVVPVYGACGALEQTVRRLKRECCCGARTRVLLVDCGMEDETRRVAQILARADALVTLCAAEEVAGYLCKDAANEG
ncbi:MAG: hypothetical protein IJF15_07490 [Oscillospiraceae bacterium]|nr:hypothetical protein [Oscillospiraceae bacterium]